MGNFRSDNKDRGFRGNRSSRDSGRSSGGFSSGIGGRPGGRGGFRDRSSGSFDRGTSEMYEVTCSKCGKQCKVPFRPTGNKPVFCSECFSKEGNSSSRRNFDSRNNNVSSQSGMSSEQFKKINTKLDKILGILEEIDSEEEDDEEDEE
ncbi:MAG: CxxC-x17-CxxC domain-containing protein [Nanoarchaeota archaeon]